MSEQTTKMRLVVVESPAKARTIGKYLGSGYRVRASVGHIRDLPERELGVDVENGFEPKYVTIRGKGKVIQELRREAEHADEVLLATDPDREGEAIAYHVAEQLGFDAANGGDGLRRAHGPRFRRVLFHEITRDAIHAALEHPTSLDMKKVEAQQARRILDRLVGYQVSPLLWKPIRPGLSAGRVQTVALRLIAEREAEIRAFVPQEYWSITAELEKAEQQFAAKLHHIDGKAFQIENEARAREVLGDIEGLPFVVSDVKRRERSKAPPAPFTTSTLQQEAAKRLGFSPSKTMRVAQQLYEGIELGSEGSVGLITYMRTDSTRVAPSAAAAATITAAKSSLRARVNARSVTLWAKSWAHSTRPLIASQATYQAVAEGRLSVDDPVLGFFPEFTPEKVSRNLAAMRVRHLLSMSTGHDQDVTRQTMSAADLGIVRAFLSLPVQHEPGTHFVYNSAASHILSELIQKLTGQTLLDYLPTEDEMKVIGLTGNIGSGKSTAAGILAGFGAHVIDADRVVHELQAPGQLVKSLFCNDQGATSCYTGRTTYDLPYADFPDARPVKKPVIAFMPLAMPLIANVSADLPPLASKTIPSSIPWSTEPSRGTSISGVHRPL